MEVKREGSVSSDTEGRRVGTGNELERENQAPAKFERLGCPTSHRLGFRQHSHVKGV